MYQILKKKTLNRTKKTIIDMIIKSFVSYIMFFYCSRNTVLESVLFMIIEQKDF